MERIGQRNCSISRTNRWSSGLHGFSWYYNLYFKAVQPYYNLITTFMILRLYNLITGVGALGVAGGAVAIYFINLVVTEITKEVLNQVVLRVFKRFVV